MSVPIAEGCQERVPVAESSEGPVPLPGDESSEAPGVLLPGDDDNSGADKDNTTLHVTVRPVPHPGSKSMHNLRIRTDLEADNLELPAISKV